MDKKENWKTVAKNKLKNLGLLGDIIILVGTILWAVGMVIAIPFMFFEGD